MNFPHQRDKSGRLAPSNTHSSPYVKNTKTTKVVAVGVGSAIDISIENSEDADTYFHQTPTTLTSYHMTILRDMACGYGLSPLQAETAVNSEWRNTWNIGVWLLDESVILSINIVQPSISNVWANIKCDKENKQVLNIISSYTKKTLLKSTVNVTQTGEGYQLQGRWSFHIIDDLVTAGLLKKESVRVSSAVLCQSRIFAWVKIAGGSEFLCTFTKDTINKIASNVPKYYSCIVEANESKNITIRNNCQASKGNFATASVTTEGWVQCQGNPDEAKGLCNAISTAIKRTVMSTSLKPFLDSMHYERLPKNF